MSNKPRAGDLVQVKTPEEIFATLDDQGCLDGLPFMPEMLAYTGKRFRVAKRAHKTCDTVNQTGGRRMRDCVHLDSLRCDGTAHDGCKASCLIFWKTGWLAPVSEMDAEDERIAARHQQPSDEFLTHLQANARRTVQADGNTIYRCQATTLFDATEHLAWWDLRQYLEDLTSGNIKLTQMMRVWFFHSLTKLMQLGVSYRLWRGIYDYLQKKVGGFNHPSGTGTVPAGAKTPTGTLGLKPGERVRIKSHEEILATLDERNFNRGMRFDEEMVPYCGKSYTVARRVDRLIHEKNGEMIDMKSPCIILEGVVCRSELSACRLFCPRAIPSYWREIWLERLDEPAATGK